MRVKRRHKRKRRLSVHQKQMRFWKVMLTVTLLLGFASAFYFLNRWLGHQAL